MRRRVLTIAIFLLVGIIVNVAVTWLLAWRVPNKPQSLNAWRPQHNIPRYVTDVAIWDVQTDRRIGAAVTRSWLNWVRHDDDRLIVNDPENDSIGSLTISKNGVMGHHSGGNFPYMFSHNVDSRLVPPWSYPRRAHSRMVDPIRSKDHYQPRYNIDERINIDQAWGWPTLAMRQEFHYLAMSERTFWSGWDPYRQVRTNAGAVLPHYPIWPGFPINTLFYAAILWLVIPGPFALRRFLRLKRGLCPKCAYPMGESAVCSECGRELPRRVRTMA